jgi:hypothetical protein
VLGQLVQFIVQSGGLGRKNLVLVWVLNIGTMISSLFVPVIIRSKTKGNENISPWVPVLNTACSV